MTKVTGSIGRISDSECQADVLAQNSESAPDAAAATYHAAVQYSVHAACDPSTAASAGSEETGRNYLKPDAVAESDYSTQAASPDDSEAVVAGFVASAA